MILDRAINTFLESYDREAIEFIENMANDQRLGYTDYKINLFNINEAFEKFNTIIENYGKYQTRILTEETKYTHDKVCSDYNAYMESEMIKEDKVKSNDIAKFVKAYIEGVDNTLRHIDEVKTKMMQDGVPGNKIGEINNFADIFMNKVNEAFTESMDKILLASGYKTKQKLSLANYKPVKKESIVPVII